MPAPSPLAILTGSVTRLIRELASYKEEEAAEQAKYESMQSSPATDEYRFRQQGQVLEETKRMVPNVRTNLQNAMKELKDKLASNLTNGEPGDAPDDPLRQAREALAGAEKAVQEA